MQVKRGLPDRLRPEAAALYWQAFGGKLGRLLGPTALALKFLALVLQSDHCLHVTDAEGRLIGLAGFKSPRGGFATWGRAELALVYGPWGGWWRQAVIRMLQQEIDNDRFLVDGLCVQQEWRGQGIGAALIRALMEEAEQRGYAVIRLDVVDTNVRARALYARMGFSVLRVDRLGLLRHVFGFSRTLVMVRPVGQVEESEDRMKIPPALPERPVR